MSAEGPLDPRRLRRAPLYLVVFGVFFGAVCALQRSLVPMPGHYDLHDKLRYFREHKDEFDLVFVGSSATFRNVVPVELDAALAEEGQRITSFNFGVVGFRSFETDTMLRWILDQEPARLKWVVLEPPPFDPPFAYEDLQATKTEMAVHSHTPQATELILRSVWLADIPAAEKRSETLRHLKLLGKNLVSLGRGPAAVRQRWADGSEWQAPDWLARDRGFQAVEDRPGFQEPPPERDPLRDREAYRSNALAIDARNRGGADLSRYNFTALERQIAAVRAAGVEPIYCLSPMVFASPEAYALGERGDLPNFLGFSLPKSYAQLFRPEKRIDLTHYRREGAVEFSRFLAPHLAEILERTAP